MKKKLTKNILVCLMTLLWTLNLSAGEPSKGKCLNALQTKSIADTIKERDELKLNLATTQDSLNSCWARDCGGQWYQDPTSIVGLMTGTFVFGLILGLQQAGK